MFVMWTEHFICLEFASLQCLGNVPITNFLKHGLPLRAFECQKIPWKSKYSISIKWIASECYDLLDFLCLQCLCLCEWRVLLHGFKKTLDKMQSSHSGASFYISGNIMSLGILIAGEAVWLIWPKTVGL